MQSGDLILQNGDELGRCEAPWLGFSAPRRTIQATNAAEVAGVLEEVAADTGAGRWAAGFVAYEAAAGLDPAFRVFDGPALGGLPLVWFGIYDAPQMLGEPESNAGFGEIGLPGYRLSAWRAGIDPEAYRRAIENLRERIAAGETYQVNFTYPMEAEFEGEPAALFEDLRRAQPTGFGALLRIPGYAILSVSPELFFAQEGDRVLARPMKGTARRGRWLEEDDARAAALAADPKERAENVMIVDLLRNDLGRVARNGSVEVKELFRVERYPAALQMTSTIEALTGTGPVEVLKALFPCGSVTGAPKIQTMKIIAELEARARGVYCGAIGWIAPGRRARFSVAIRTLQLDLEAGRATFGTGGGITWDSAAAAEYVETRIKAAPLLAPRPAFRLMEALLWRPDGGYFLMERHLKRLADSARYFGWGIDLEAIKGELERYASGLPALPHKVRFLFDASGAMELGAEAIDAPQLDRGASVAREPLHVGLANAAVDSGDPFLFHKTTERPVYRRVMEEHPDWQDALFVNERGELTESTRANLVVEIDGKRWTPPRECGLLAGTLRDELLARGEIVERILYPDDLCRAEGIWLVNSVRGWMAAEIAGAAAMAALKSNEAMEH